MAPKGLQDLIEHFDRNLYTLKSAQYNEAQVRREFIDPFFTLLGWDMDNRQGYAEAYKDVIHEDAIKIGGYTKAPDYCFRIGGTRKFFVEAKKPAVNIKDDPDPAYQLRRYAWSAKLPLSILTDFEELAVYDCRIKPAPSDKASAGRVLYLTYTDFEKEWESLASIFSREAVLKGSFDKYVESNKAKRGTAEVDAAFLKEIEAWRDALARNLALRNQGLTTRELNFAVQATIDRIIFLRICEDRGVEDYARLMALQNGDEVYKRLMALFRSADERYNSGLFHFEPEKGRETHDALTPGLSIDDKVLKEIIKGLYYPESPYEFSVLPADILGQVYEQFLGKVIRLTVGHQAKVDDKPEVKKAGGVYYTPTYIVDYIVKNTVGKMLEGKTHAQISGRRGGAPSPPVAVPGTGAGGRGGPPLRILDPACGSGSFLLGAYQYLLTWYRDRYVEDGPDKWARRGGPLRPPGSGRAGTVEPALYQAPGGEWKLTTSERKRILLSHIYGVDIDVQAVEVTKLSLLLKVLEGETKDSVSSQRRLFNERALPDLSRNIKCGNSLIGSDFYKGQQIALFDEDERARINAFDWEDEFPEVFRVREKPKGGDKGKTFAAEKDAEKKGEFTAENAEHAEKRRGFDVVIGNPPYVDIKGMPQIDVDYIFSHYPCANSRINLFSVFMERSILLLRPTRGRFSMIVPAAMMTQDSYEALRVKISQHLAIRSIVRLPNESFGDAPGKVKVDTVIVVMEQPLQLADDVEVIGYEGYSRIREIDQNTASILRRVPQASWVVSPDHVWSLAAETNDIAILRKCELDSINLEECAEFSLGLTPYDKYKGQSSADISAQIYHADCRKDASFKPLLLGNDVRRYLISWNGHSWISYGPWLGAPREQRFFTKKRILVKQIIDWTTKQIWAALTDQELFNAQNAFNLLAKQGWKEEYLLGLLNSRLMTYYHRKKYLDEFKMRFQKILIKDCRRFPIKAVLPGNVRSMSQQGQIVDLVARILALHSGIAMAKTDHDKALLQRQITATDKEIDRLVYDLYGLTDDEIRIVEES